MATLEEITPKAALRGIQTDGLVVAQSATSFGDDA